ncbi:THxN family PEP-CTERM protein [Uliginosibacterium sp. H1]|uniref:THxN family PEP-CTERM protein n=1 Tax=Uliginosibacterium sp. H1 TaxID=3114757 RepID=UPI002E18022E|nr:THxN family PEP-CTERM protein [Uliginosibacterium sp. H1]
MLRPLLAVVSSTLISVAPLTASAAAVSLGAFTGTWINATPAAVASNAGASLNWGLPADGSTQSGYDFLAAAGVNNFEIPPSPDPFLIGNFVHRNIAVFGESLSSAQLQLTTSIYVDGVSIGERSFLFGFSHLESLNVNGTCADGGQSGAGVNANGCADNVQISSLNASDTFVIDGDEWTLDLLGFSRNGGADIDLSYWTMENQSNTAGLYATVSRSGPVRQVPAPDGLSLLGISLLGMTLIHKRRR